MSGEKGHGKFNRKYAVSSSMSGSRRDGGKMDTFDIYFEDRISRIYWRRMVSSVRKTLSLRCSRDTQMKISDRQMRLEFWARHMNFSVMGMQRSLREWEKMSSSLQSVERRQGSEWVLITPSLLSWRTPQEFSNSHLEEVGWMEEEQPRTLTRSDQEKEEPQGVESQTSRGKR